MNTRVLKEPLGFIRVIELPMAILAFATTAGYSAVTTIHTTCEGQKDKVPTSVDWGYSFDLTSLEVNSNLCNLTTGTAFYLFGAGAVSQSQFFVLIGVISFIYILAILVVYIYGWPNYENDKRFALGDLVATAVLALFWFISSCAWASGVSTVKTQTDVDLMENRLRLGVYPCNITDQKQSPCDIPHTWNYASLNVSLIAGFTCFGLWLTNLWFIYKETAWYKLRSAPPTGVTGGPATHGYTGASTFR